MSKDLAAELDVSEAAVSRWINDKRGLSAIRRHQIERFFKLPPGALYRSPESAPEEALLAGLDETQRASVMEYIRFVRSQKN